MPNYKSQRNNKKKSKVKKVSMAEKRKNFKSRMNVETERSKECGKKIKEVMNDDNDDRIMIHYYYNGTPIVMCGKYAKEVLNYFKNGVDWSVWGKEEPEEYEKQLIAMEEALHKSADKSGTYDIAKSGVNEMLYAMNVYYLVEVINFLPNDDNNGLMVIDMNAMGLRAFFMDGGL